MKIERTRRNRDQFDFFNGPHIIKMIKDSRPRSLGHKERKEIILNKIGVYPGRGNNG